MFFASSFASGFGLAAALIVAVGAQNIFVLRQGLRQRHVAPVVAFCALSDLLLVSAGVAGIGMLLHTLPGLVRQLTWGMSLGGAVFLSWYGISAARRALAPGALVTGGAEGPDTLAGTMGRAAAFTYLNPHVYLDTVLLMGAVGGALPGGARPLFVAGAATASALWFVVLGYGARLLGPVFARPAAWRVLDSMVAAVMMVMAVMLAARSVGP
ncbi:LysE/ArgO family amino acid transporter [Gluconacetobacter diazotrophicus]|uniref:Putative lysine exporter protein n=1 Tax=Gluconacetobacter diazotrophicus (strain ATCC 49037 / DSM 5601 / CCUG 37298 / CIP 103539 / LMG 7603 / PAl5) TaxID=272568 RepID=A9H8L3_GLUDA|nr:LysE/ArgO family amino acid transporter [Gluconacetobacter diazotrophicus]TWB09733.1 L-lysine exporter family protein LysE/ArgO [Gluconacetobacter diazotrophicus]CAP54547.1 putative lysine exporter protein [Gluconacetobacter diazotrophicus PA1 5]